MNFLEVSIVRNEHIIWHVRSSWVIYSHDWIVFWKVVTLVFRFMSTDNFNLPRFSAIIALTDWTCIVMAYLLALDFYRRSLRKAGILRMNLVNISGLPLGLRFYVVSPMRTTYLPAFKSCWALSQLYMCLCLKNELLEKTRLISHNLSLKLVIIQYYIIPFFPMKIMLHCLTFLKGFDYMILKSCYTRLLDSIRSRYNN